MEEPEQLRNVVSLVARVADVERAQFRKPPVQFIETLEVSMGEGVGVQGRCASGCVFAISAIKQQARTRKPRQPAARAVVPLRSVTIRDLGLELEENRSDPKLLLCVD